MCRRAPRRSLLLSSVAQPTAPWPSARATRTAPAARSGVAPYSASEPTHPHTTAPDYSDTTVQRAGFSFSDNRSESRNRVADKRCATRCARNSRAASHSPAGSVSQAGKWRKRRREAACVAHTLERPAGSAPLFTHGASR